MKQLLYFSGGVIVGGIIACYITKRYYERVAEEEIASVMELVADIKEKYEGNKEVNKSKDEDKKTVEKIISKEMYRTSEQYTRDHDEGDEKVLIYDDYPREDRAVKPYVIDGDTFSEDFHGFDKCVLVYWSGNDVLLTEEHEPMDIETTIGRSSLEHFGEEEAYTIFVRNERLGTDFEVLLEEASYAEE